VESTSCLPLNEFSVGASAQTARGRTVVHSGVRPTVLIFGRADRAAISEASGAIRGLRAVGLRHVVIDVSGALDCDGRLLTMLARAHAQLADDTGTLEITGVKLPQFLPALRTAALDEVFVIYDAVRRETNRHGRIPSVTAEDDRRADASRM
jgi:hypothetical protein